MFEMAETERHNSQSRFGYFQPPQRLAKPDFLADGSRLVNNYLLELLVQQLRGYISDFSIPDLHFFEVAYGNSIGKGYFIFP